MGAGLKLNIWNTIKAIFWGLAIGSVSLNTFNVIAGADSLGKIIFIFSVIGLVCALLLTLLKNKQGKKLEILNQ
jgi:preprotein translocase subunit SecG